jgi:ParB-like chromosome segregation protein Spo0J
MVVKGHGRLMAAELLGCKTVPVDFQDYENESLELADLMADNRIAELSQIDNKKLLNLFEEFDSGKVEFNLSGYDEKFYEELAHSFDEYVKEKVVKTLKCPNCGLEIEV